MMIKITFFLLTFSLLASTINANTCSQCDLNEETTSYEVQDCHQGSDTNTEATDHDCCPLCTIIPQYITPLKNLKVYFNLSLLNQIHYFNRYQSLKVEPQIRPPISNS